MRQIFTSQRLETVEGVARLLEDNGIETYTSERRSYRGNRRSGFSYSTPDHRPQPGVWVIRAEDLVRARDLLRRAGLLESTQTGSYLPAGGITLPSQAANDSGSRMAMRIRLGLLAVLGAGAVLTTLRMLGVA